MSLRQNKKFSPRNRDELRNALYEFLNRSDAYSKYGNISSWDVSRVNDFSELFEGISGVDKFQYDLSSWDTSNAINMRGMFRNCKKYNNGGAEIFFPTNNVVDMSEMFAGCENLNIHVRLNTLNVTNMSGMFKNCVKFNNGVSAGQKSSITFNTRNVIDMSEMFLGCRSFNCVVDFETDSVISTMYMFYQCSSFNNGEIDFEADLRNAQNISCMFTECAKLKVNVMLLNTNQVIESDGVFWDCFEFNNGGYAFVMDCSNVENLYKFFTNCVKLNVEVIFFNTNKLKNINELFSGCVSFTNAGKPLTLKTLNVQSLKKYDVFYNCPKFNMQNFKLIDIDELRYSSEIAELETAIENFEQQDQISKFKNWIQLSSEVISDDLEENQPVEETDFLSNVNNFIMGFFE